MRRPSLLHRPRRLFQNLAPPFDPASLSFADWREPNYGGLPWAANASAGTSGTRVEGNSVFGNTTAPIAGRVLNGFTSARYTSGAKGSSPGNAGSTNISPTAFSLSALIYIESAAPGGGATPYTEIFLYGELAGYGSQATLSQDGLKMSRFNGGSWDSRAIACGVGAWKLCDIRFGSGTLEMRVNRGAWDAVAFGNFTAGVSSGSGPATGGAVYNAAAATDFNLMTRFIAPTRLSNADFDNWASYINTKYNTNY